MGAVFDGSSVGRDVNIHYYITRDSVAFVGPRDAPLSAPSLVWSDLPDAIEPDGLNSLSLLRWNFRLVETLYGRAEAQEKILNWARGSRNAALARLIQGEGGAGKTRLAAEVAKALRNEGWTAGFLPRKTTEFYFPANPKGVLLIVDYPEEQPERTKALLDRLADLAETTHPLRVLFLSRRPYDQWIDQATHLGGRFGGQAIAAPQPLTVEEAEALIAEAAHRFRALAGPAGVKGLSLAAFDPSRVRSWLAQDDKHRLPLYAAAAAVQAVLDPAKAFGQTGAKVLTSLVEREFSRVKSASEAIGLGENGLIRLLALGVLADGLTQDQIRDLIGLGVGGGVKADYFERLAESPWWQQGRLIRLEPDALAAAFLNRALFRKELKGRSEVPEWLYAALRNSDAALFGRLERVLFDLLSIAPRDGGGHALEDALVNCVRREPERARAFEGVSGERIIWCARFAAEVARSLADQATDDSDRARHLRNLARNLWPLGMRDEVLIAIEKAVSLYRSLAQARPEAFKPELARSLTNLSIARADLGQREAALAASEEAVGFYRALAPAQREALKPDLARSLNNLSLRLADLGQREAALVAIEEAVILRQALVQERSDVFKPDLALSLNNLSNCLAALGQREVALEAIEGAVSLYRLLAHRRPEAFLRELAESLKNLSTRLAALGQREAALAASEEAVTIYRPLAQARPAMFLPELARSLNNLSTCLADLGQRESGLAAIEEAVTLQRELAQARPEAFLPELARSLTNLSFYLGALGKREAALAVSEEAVTIYRPLAEARPGAFLPELARSLNNLSIYLGDLGQREAALAAVEEAVSLYRPLAQVRPDAFKPDLALSLHNLSVDLGDLGQREAALAAIEEAVSLYRSLAQARPAAFLPDLAGSLHNLNNRLAALGQREAALAAIEKAVTIYRPLAQARPAVFQKGLREALDGLSTTLSALGRPSEAAAAAAEAAGLEE